MSYLFLKHLHMTCAVLTLISFSLRGFWMFIDSPLLQKKAVRVLPHIIDSLLLASAIALTITIQQYPVHDAWLSAKVAALIAYIIFGTFALKRGRTQTIRATCFVISLLIFAYIIAVARTHQAIPWASTATF